MAQRSRYGAVDPRNPEAAGRCDRGGEVRRLSELRREMVYAGGRLVWNGFLCCASHIDPPHPQDALLVLPADPMPVPLSRPNIDAATSPIASRALEASVGIAVLTDALQPIEV